MHARPVALRTSLVWRDEVMEDVVADMPRRITIGSSGRPTFVVPDVGLPNDFAIITPGNRGYVLTLGAKMRGKVSINGKEQAVRDFVASSADADDGFHATPINAGDWGVIDLDEAGEFKLFFQFVPIDQQIAGNSELFSTLTVTAAISLIGMIALVIGWRFLRVDYELPRILEWSFRSIGLIAAGLVVFGAIWSLINTDPETQASTGFSILLHGALLIGTYFVYDKMQKQDVWPGTRATTANYMVSRLADAVKEEEKKPELKFGPKQQDAAPLSPTKPQPKLAATKNESGAAGGKGETERARDPKARENERLAALDNTVFHGKNAQLLNNITDRNLTSNLGKFTGIKGDVRTGSMGFGPGTGIGVGEGDGTGTTKGGKKGNTGGGGQAEGDFVTSGPIDTGKERAGGKCVGPNCKGVAPKPVAVAFGEIGGDIAEYTAEEINRVIRQRAGLFRACYQKVLNRIPGIAGKVVIKFKIGADGKVMSAAPLGTSTLSNEEVQSCVSGNVARLSFPPKGAIANVTYPFLFSPGG